MRYVIDASTALKWVLSEPDSDKANRFRDEVRHGVHELIAPDVFSVEIAHALTRAERRGLISDAEACWLDVMSTAPQLHLLAPLVRRAIQMSRLARIGVYDCLYLALAEREGCDLLTADDRLR